MQSGSIFVSLSPPDDRLRAPEGYRTISVSTHVADPGFWVDLKREDPLEYLERKEEYQEQIIGLIGEVLPGFSATERRFEQIGTPASFHLFTGRHRGTVGGVPFSKERSLFRLPGWQTTHKNLAIVGDTVYPGQGVPAVVLGAMNMVAGMAR